MVGINTLDCLLGCQHERISEYISVGSDDSVKATGSLCVLAEGETGELGKEERTSGSHPRRLVRE